MPTLKITEIIAPAVNVFRSHIAITASSIKHFVPPVRTLASCCVCSLHFLVKQLLIGTDLDVLKVNLPKHWRHVFGYSRFRQKLLLENHREIQSDALPSGPRVQNLHLVILNFLPADKEDLELIAACERNDFERLEELLLKPKDPSIQQLSTGKTLIHIAAENGSQACLELLLEALPKPLDPYLNHVVWGGTPLHAAAKAGHKNVVDFLIQLGADKEIRTTCGATPLHVAATTGRRDVVMLLITKKAQINQHIDANGSTNRWTPLHCAASHGHNEVVRLLLDSGANHTIASQSGMTPLHLAAESGHLNVVLMLHWYGANPKVLTENSSTSLLLASCEGHLGVVDFLLAAGVDPNQATTDNRSTPLRWAAENGHLAVAKMLVSAGANINTTTTDDDATPLHFAAANGHLDVVCFLIELGADVDSVTRIGVTPLHWASMNDHVEVVRFLVMEAGANFTLAMNLCGVSTPFDLAMQANSRRSARFLDSWINHLINLEILGWNGLSGPGSPIWTYNM